MISQRWWSPPTRTDAAPATELARPADVSTALAITATPRGPPDVPLSPVGYRTEPDGSGRSRWVGAHLAGPRVCESPPAVGSSYVLVKKGSDVLRFETYISYQDLLDEFPRCVQNALVRSVDPELISWLALVGIEPNPGPTKKMKKAVIVVPKKTKGTIKKVVEVVEKRRPPVKAASSGGSIGKSIGSSVGGWVGDMAQKAIMAITGFGDYTVRSNTLTNGGSPPQFAMGRHCTKVCHREFVGLVSSPGAAFTLTSYPLNPTSGLFPWLSEIALSYEQWTMRGMVVEFKTTSATAVSSTNTALGSVILATQYNVLAPAFVNQQQMEAYEFCTSCAPKDSMIHPIECAPGANSVPELFVDQPISSGTSFPGPGDPRLSNLGTVYIATVGQQAASVVGELWVSYEIDLIRPKLFSGIQNLGLTYRISAGGIAAAYSGTSLINDPWNCIAQAQQGAGGGTIIRGGGSDLPVLWGSGSSTLQPNGLTAGQISLPGWLTGNVLFVIGIGFTLSSVTGTIVFTGGAVPTPAVLSGNATFLNTWASQSTTPGGRYGFGNTQGTITASGNASTVFLTAIVNCSGNNPSVPVVLYWVPFLGTTSSLTVAYVDAVVTTIGTTF